MRIAGHRKEAPERQKFYELLHKLRLGMLLWYVGYTGMRPIGVIILVLLMHACILVQSSSEV